MQLSARDLLRGGYIEQRKPLSKACAYIMRRFVFPINSATMVRTSPKASMRVKYAPAA